MKQKTKSLKLKPKTDAAVKEMSQKPEAMHRVYEAELTPEKPSAGEVLTQPMVKKRNSKPELTEAENGQLAAKAKAKSITKREVKRLMDHATKLTKAEAKQMKAEDDLYPVTEEETSEHTQVSDENYEKAPAVKQGVVARRSRGALESALRTASHFTDMEQNETVELGEFIRSALVQITKAAKEARVEIEKLGGEVNPKIHGEDKLIAQAGYLITQPNSRRIMTVVEFDVAVTAKKEAGKSAGIGVLPASIGGKMAESSQTMNSPVSRLSFKVPISLPCK